MARNSILWAERTLHGTDRFGQWKVLQGRFQGWLESPEIKGETVARQNSDGDYDLPTYNEARIVEIGGQLVAPGRRELIEARNFLAGPMLGRLQVTDEDVTQWADAKRTSGVRFNILTPRLAHWQLTLKCADPRKFGLRRSEELVGGLSRSLYHYGNAAASPVVVINGPVTGGYTLSSNDGRQYRVNAGINSGSTHTVDMNDGLLRVDGAVQSGLVGQADIWDIPAGKILNMALVADSGDATGEVLITDTYI